MNTFGFWLYSIAVHSMTAQIVPVRDDDQNARVYLRSDGLCLTSCLRRHCVMVRRDVK